MNEGKGLNTVSQWTGVTYEGHDITSVDSRKSTGYPSFDKILNDNGVTVLPDILANAGGVTVSYFEWVQGLDNYFWDLKQVQDELQKVMERAFDAVNAKADEADCDYRTAAYTLAMLVVGAVLFRTRDA